MSSKEILDQYSGKTLMCGLLACCGNEAGLEQGHLGEKRFCFNGLPSGYLPTERSRNIRGKAEEWWQRGVVLQDESVTSGDAVKSTKVRASLCALGLAA